MQQGAGDQQPASHAPAELVDLGVAAIAQVGDLQRAVDRRPSLASRHAVEVREHEQVLLDCQRHVEVVELGHHPHLRARLLRVLGQPEAEHLQLTLVGDHLGGERLHRGRLAGAVRPQEANALPVWNVQVEAVDGGDRPEPLHEPSQHHRGRRLSLI